MDNKKPLLILEDLIKGQPMMQPSASIFYQITRSDGVEEEQIGPVTVRYEYSKPSYGPPVPWTDGCPHGFGMPGGCICNCRELWLEDRSAWKRSRYPALPDAPGPDIEPPDYVEVMSAEKAAGLVTDKAEDVPSLDSESNTDTDPF